MCSKISHEIKTLTAMALIIFIFIFACFLKYLIMVDIVIVNWNSGDYLQKCVQSIFHGNNQNLVHKVFIIDNNSSDSSLKKIESNQKVNIIINNQNVGFSKACNQGFRMCSADYILLLNPDVKLFENTISDCILFMSRVNDIDILGCQLLNDNNEISFSCSRFPSVAGIFRDSMGLSKIAPSIFKPGIIMSDWHHKESRFVDQVMGAFMFMHKSIFEKVGYFDERFFVYYEEVDFSKRLSEIGGKSFFTSEIQAIHTGEGTTSSVKAFRSFLNLQSRLRYAEKHFKSTGYWCVWFCTFFIEPLTKSVFLLFSGRKNEIFDLFKGYKLLLKKEQNGKP
jgi:GT2 family glycosyltransferase